MSAQEPARPVDMVHAGPGSRKVCFLSQYLLNQIITFKKCCPKQTNCYSKMHNIHHRSLEFFLQTPQNCFKASPEIYEGQNVNRTAILAIFLG